jgi:hypothetical protein
MIYGEMATHRVRSWIETDRGRRAGDACQGRKGDGMGQRGKGVIGCSEVSEHAAS